MADRDVAGIGRAVVPERREAGLDPGGEPVAAGGLRLRAVLRRHFAGVKFRRRLVERVEPGLAQAGEVAVFRRGPVAFEAVGGQ